MENIPEASEHFVLTMSFEFFYLLSRAISEVSREKRVEEMSSEDWGGYELDDLKDQRSNIFDQNSMIV